MLFNQGTHLDVLQCIYTVSVHESLHHIECISHTLLATSTRAPFASNADTEEEDAATCRGVSPF